MLRLFLIMGFLFGVAQAQQKTPQPVQVIPYAKWQLVEMDSSRYLLNNQTGKVYRGANCNSYDPAKSPYTQALVINCWEPATYYDEKGTPLGLPK